MQDVNAFFDWLKANPWATTLFIIAVGYIIERLGSWLIPPIIRISVGRISSDTTAEDRKKHQDTLISLMRALFKVLVWVVILFKVLEATGSNIATILASAGVIGVALGFGAQSIIKDFLSGLVIILENQYRVGDIVTINDASTGAVERISIRCTILRDIDGNVHFIPNGTISKAINKTLGFSKINLAIKVKPDTNVEKLTTIINQVGQDMAADPQWQDNILQPPHFHGIENFTETALEVTITSTTQPSKQWNVTTELRRRLLAAFKKHKIDLAAS